MSRSVTATQRVVERFEQCVIAVAMIAAVIAGWAIAEVAHEFDEMRRAAQIVDCGDVSDTWRELRYVEGRGLCQIR